MADPQQIWLYLQARLGQARSFGRLRQRGDAGVITTEMAVIAFVLVTGAIVVAGILITAATNSANNLPAPGG